MSGQRQAKYAKAIRDEIHMSLGSAARLARIVIALADAEQKPLREWQREVCDQFGYDSDEPGNADEVLAYLPFWRGEAAGYADEVQRLSGGVS